MSREEQTVCPVCHGKGQIEAGGADIVSDPPYSMSCERCHGTGRATTRDTRDEQLSDEEFDERIGRVAQLGSATTAGWQLRNAYRAAVERAEEAERALAELAKIHHETRKPSALHADATAFGACEALSCISARNVLRLAHVKEGKDV